MLMRNAPSVIYVSYDDKRDPLQKTVLSGTMSFHYSISIASIYNITVSRSINRKQLFLVDLGEVFLGLFNFRLDGFGTWGPVGRTNFTVLLSELEGLQQSDGLINGSTDWQVVDSDLSQDTIGVNQKDSSQGDTSVFNQNTVVLGQRVVGVSQQWDVDRTQATVLSGDIGPGQQRVFRVGRSKQNLGIQVSKLLDSLGVGNDFGGADKSECQWDECKKHPLTLVLFQGDLFKHTVNDSGLLESRSRLLDEGNHDDVLLVYEDGVEKLETSGKRRDDIQRIYTILANR